MLKWPHVTYVRKHGAPLRRLVSLLRAAHVVRNKDYVIDAQHMIKTSSCSRSLISDAVRLMNDRLKPSSVQQCARFFEDLKRQRDSTPGEGLSAFQHSGWSARLRSTPPVDATKEENYHLLFSPVDFYGLYMVERSCNVNMTIQYVRTHDDTTSIPANVIPLPALNSELGISSFKTAEDGTLCPVSDTRMARRLEIHEPIYVTPLHASSSEANLFLPLIVRYHLRIRRSPNVFCVVFFIFAAFGGQEEQLRPRSPLDLREPHVRVQTLWPVLLGPTRSGAPREPNLHGEAEYKLFWGQPRRTRSSPNGSWSSETVPSLPGLLSCFKMHLPAPRNTAGRNSESKHLRGALF